MELNDINNKNIIDKDYAKWISELKNKVHSSRIKATLAVNSILIELYWELGKMISEKIETGNWGDKILEKVSEDLKKEFPEMQGLSRSNLAYMKQFYLFYQSKIVQQSVGQLFKDLIIQIPWGHNILIFSKSTNIEEAIFYIQKTIENNWSRDILGIQIKSDLYKRQGSAITNFKYTLPALHMI